MNKIYKIFSSLVVSVLMFVACTPDDHSLGKVDVSPSDLVEGIAFTITHDSQNPNIVYLKSLKGTEYTPVWHHPQGNSQGQEVTLKMPFEGTYPVQFGVETRGGLVYGDTVYFQIDDFYADFVSGEMWVNLAGGVGESKTWIPDNGNYGMKQGFYSCFDPSTTWEDMVADVEYDWYAKDKTWWQPSDGDVGNTEEDLLSYMTFSLEGKAGLTVYRYSNGEHTATEGTFNMNEEEHTISAVGVDFLHGEWATENAVDFRTGFQILVLTENQLMIANYRDEALSGEGAAIYCWNFVSKDWADNYVEEDTEDPVPDLGRDPNDLLTTNTTNTKTWVLSLETPYIWMDLNGNFMNEFSSPEDYLSTGWAAYDASMLEKVKFIFTSTGAASGSYELTDAYEDVVSGTYMIDNNNDITFDQPLDAIITRQQFDGWEDVKRISTTSENKLRIMKVVTNAIGLVTDMYLGSRDETGKKEYLAYHFVLGESSGSSE